MTCHSNSLSNQGDLVMQPGKNVFAYSLAYYIAVDERGHAMLAVVKNAERGWSIVSYPL